jgi:hypothetical protein
MYPITTASLAAAFDRKRFGIAMEAMMPITVTTISSSTRLKPALSERKIRDFGVISQGFSVDAGVSPVMVSSL